MNERACQQLMIRQRMDHDNYFKNGSVKVQTSKHLVICLCANKEAELLISTL